MREFIPLDSLWESLIAARADYPAAKGRPVR